MAKVYEVPARVREGSPGPMTNLTAYRDAVAQANADPDGYWLRIAKERLRWRTQPTQGLSGDFHSVRTEPLRWFADGELNVCESCVDRHVEVQPDKVAILWEGDEPQHVRRVTYGELHREVCRLANVLADLGVRKGDRVVVYMGMVPETAMAMLACARLGAVHSVVFGGFSAEALRDRIRDCSPRLIITQDEGRRGGKSIPLKAVVDEALATLSVEERVEKVLVYEHTSAPIDWVEERDLHWQREVGKASAEHAAVVCNAEDPLFVLYTSGSTGKPKGLLHTSGGYLTYVSHTHELVFDLRPDDIYACVADVGWITGHSYVVYGPLSNGATTVMFESVPTYPNPGRYWDMVERHRITIFYTAPTALRTLAARGEAPVKAYDRSSLRVLGTVGEPINPEAWEWYHHTVGEGRCAVVDTWWQTETGGICLSPLAAVTPTKPGSATFPLPGHRPELMDAQGQPLPPGPGAGYLCLAQPWPGQARTIWGDHRRFVATYFEAYPGYYFTGDGCRRDEEGYYWITGRVDDVLNVSGHRMGTAEFEAALVKMDAVAEAAVVGYPHPVKGQGVYAYVVLRGQPSASEPLDTELQDELQGQVRRAIGAHAKVDVFQAVPGLPKTRSGKVMRRVLRKIAAQETDSLGDISTLADPAVVEHIIAGASRPR